MDSILLKGLVAYYGFNSNATPIVLQNISRSRSFVLAGIGT